MRLNMKINNLNELNTPCLILDKKLLEKNCSKARKKCNEFNTILRHTLKLLKVLKLLKLLLEKMSVLLLFPPWKKLNILQVQVSKILLMLFA